MIYRFNIYQQENKSPFRNYRRGLLKKISINGKLSEVGIQGPAAMEVVNKFDLVDYVEIEVKYYRSAKEPYPDFISISVVLDAANSSAIKYLEQHGINFKRKPVRIENDQSVSYELITFPTRDLIDIEASKAYVKDDGSLASMGENYFDGKIVLKKESKTLKGIYRLDRLGNALVCDEETKQNLEKSGLTGFYFEELGVSGD